MSVLTHFVDFYIKFRPYAATMDGKGREAHIIFSHDDWGVAGGAGRRAQGAAAPTPATALAPSMGGEWYGPLQSLEHWYAYAVCLSRSRLVRMFVSVVDLSCQSLCIPTHHSSSAGNAHWWFSSQPVCLFATRSQCLNAVLLLSRLCGSSRGSLRQYEYFCRDARLRLSCGSFTRWLWSARFLCGISAVSCRTAENRGLKRISGKVAYSCREAAIRAWFRAFGNA